jgi:ribosomal protein L37AE/L43A
MTLQFLCPGCEQVAFLQLRSLPETWTCPKCGKALTPVPQAKLAEGGQLVRCAICAGERFYTQRDFNQRIGCLVAGIGAALSPFTYGISLLVCLALDGGLYFLLKQATVCYRCGSIYRGTARNPEHGAFDLHTAELEAQESKYILRGSP